MTPQNLQPVSLGTRLETGHLHASPDLQTTRRRVALAPCFPLENEVDLSVTRPLLEVQGGPAGHTLRKQTPGS